MLWRQAASLMIEQGDHSEAVKSLEELRKNSPNDVVTLAQLIVAYAQVLQFTAFESMSFIHIREYKYLLVNVQYDIGKAQKLSDQLPPVRIPPEIDVANLESSNWLSSVKLLKKSTKTDSTPTSPTGDSGKLNKSEQIVRVKSKTKKKKKKHLPVNLDPDKQLDPERWLPRYERAGYKPKKSRKGRGDVGKGTQGASSETAAI